MPRSANHCPVEIPTALYAQLAERTQREGRPVASVAADHLTDGLDAQERDGRLSSEIVALRCTVEALRLALEARLPPRRVPAE